MSSPTGPGGPSQSSAKPAGEPPGNAAPASRKIGKYEIQKKIGAGGMGAVYLALDPTLKRVCALKVLPRDKAANPTLVKRFKAEAQAAANLRHENIVTVFDAGESDGYLYIALEYVEGTDVANLVQQRGVIPLKRSVEIVRQVAQALQHAHGQGIVHRDIKPGNLLVRRDGVVKLADLGLARSLDDNVDTSITRAGTTVGTVDYMAPEQARDSKAADVRSDLYSLGCTWYFMLTGEPPFPTGSLTNKLRAHAETQIPDPRSLNPAVSEAVFGVLRRMTEKKPGQRYQTPNDLIADLESTSLTSDNVSDTILADLAEGSEGAGAEEYGDDDDFEPAESGGDGSDKSAGRRKKKSKASKRSAADSDGGSPAFKPPPGRDRDKDKLLGPEKQARSNAALFYSLVGLVVLGLVTGIVTLVKEYGAATSSSPNEQTANAFANRQALAKKAGHVAADGQSVGGATGTNIQGTGPANPGQTTVGTGDTAIGASGTTVGTGGAGAQIESTTVGQTQVGGEANPSATQTIGTGDSSTGNPANPGSTGNVGTTVGIAAPRSPVTVGGAGSTSIGSQGTSVGTTPPGTSSGQRNPGTAPRPSPELEARTRQESAFLQNWVNPARGTGGLATLIVQQGGSKSGQVATLNQALERVPETGAVIKLAGPGPFPLYPIRIADKTRIVIEPLDGSGSVPLPIVVLLGPDEGSATSFLEVSNTTLELRRTHVVVDAGGISAGPDDALLSAVSSDLYLVDCSLSVKGTPTTPMTAVKISGKVAGRGDSKASGQPRVLFDNTLIRGNNLTSLAINTEYLDLAIRNSLLWSGRATALRFATIARGDSNSGRTLRLASTTISSQRSAVQFGGDALQPVPTSMELMNSLVAAPAGSSGAVLVAMEGWNQNQQKTALGRFLTWKSIDSLYTGWPTLIQLNPGAVSAATSLAHWQRDWKDKSSAEKDQFQAEPWPARSISDVGTVDFDVLAPQTVGKQYVKTDEGGWPGCSTERLAVLNLDSLAAAHSAVARAAIPPGLFGSLANEIVTIDASNDLGKSLEKMQLRSGMQIVVTGHGLKQSSPIVIENAWIRVQFEQDETAPLVITPRSADSKHDGFITVINGGVEIVGGVFTIPASERATLPKWFIQVVDGDLAMWRCRLHGPLSGGTRNKGLIQWQSKTGKAPSRPFEGTYDGYAVFDSCYLAGSGTLLDADARRRAIIFRNSIAVSRDDLFSLNIDQPGSEIGGTIDLGYSTLSALDRFFLVRGGNLGAPAKSPLLMYADRCVFAPPLKSGQQKATPVFLSCTGPVLNQKQVTWWENHCGYAPEITGFLRDESDSAATTRQDFEQVWLKRWGADQIAEPLLGANGVVLQKDLPTKAEDRFKLEPTDFHLHPASRAATWDLKRPIGAAVGNMNLPPLRPVAAAADKKKPAGKAPPAGGAATPGF